VESGSAEKFPLLQVIAARRNCLPPPRVTAAAGCRMQVAETSWLLQFILCCVVKREDARGKGDERRLRRARMCTEEECLRPTQSR
jgi:hypothetical protein